MKVPCFLTALLCAVFYVNANKIILSFPKNKVPTPGTESRIFGGSVAKETQFPYTIFVLIRRDVLTTCTASLVRVDKVLMAAHCVPSDVIPSNVLMVAGKADLSNYMAFRMKSFSQAIDERAFGIQERQGEEIFRSEGFTNPSTLEHDLAIVSVRKPFELSVNVQLIPIATDKLTDRTRCTILGWGLTEGNTISSNLLYSPSAYIVPLEMCKHKASGPFLCVERSRSGICQGDSGSPLVCNDKVYGVASHILAMVQNAECGNDVEEVYAELFSDMDWINEKLTNTVVDTKQEEEKPQKGTGGAGNFVSSAFIIAYFTGLTLAL